MSRDRLCASVLAVSAGLTNWHSVGAAAPPSGYEIEFQDTVGPRYPLPLAAAGREGVVVVRVDLDTTGKVTGSTLVTGEAGFSDVALRHVRTLAFTVNRGNATYMVYDFELDGTCQDPPESISVRRHENLMVILTCNPLANP
jgi:TonB family protein